MSNRRVHIIVAAALALALTTVGCALWQTPAEPTATPVPPTAAPEDTEAPTAAPTDTAEPGERVCGRSEAAVVLVLLIDSSLAEDGGVLRAARLVEADFPGREVTSLTVPRALLVEESEEDPPTLEEVYRQAASENEGEPVQAGSRAVAEALSAELGVESDHYVTVDFSELAGIIDAVGGVDVEIGQEFDATEYGLPHFMPGTMHMEGELAVAYAITRTDTGRWSGLRRQTEVLRALREQALQPSIVPQLPDLIRRFSDAVTTDLTIDAGLRYACLAREVEVDEVVFVGIDHDMVSELPDGALDPDLDQVRELLEEAFTTVEP